MSFPQKSAKKQLKLLERPGTTRPEPTSQGDTHVHDQMNGLKTHPKINLFLEKLWLKDPATYSHCHRVGELSQWLAKELGLSAQERVEAYLCGLLHDIGKINTPDSVLKKPGPLNEEEFSIIKLHPQDSGIMVSQMADLAFLSDAIRSHHERIDGRGYPDKKKGENIPLYSRIVLVADTFDAMTNNRVYRKPIDLERTYEEIHRCAGSQFDSAAALGFIAMHQRKMAEAEVKKSAA